MTIYLDNNATTQPLPEVVEAISTCLASHWANPSSTHRPGLAARNAVERARAEVAALLGTPEKSVVFASGATESIAMAIFGAWRADPRRGMVVCPATEHSAVLGSLAAVEALGGRAARCPVAPSGIVELGVLERILAAERVSCVSVGAANNETGVIQDVAAISALVRRVAPSALIHTDATQAVGKVPVSMEALGVDLLSCSAHKFHGPKGVGALAIRAGVAIEPLVVGSQERGRRAGTEAVADIVGMGVAAAAAASWLHGASPVLRDRFELRLSQLLEAHPGVHPTFHGAGAARLWNTSSVGLAGLQAESIVIALSERQVAIGAGAACASGSLEPSPALLAMGMPEPLAHGTVRVSLSRLTTADEVDGAAAALAEVVVDLSVHSRSLR